ncbi:uncharacterized protein Gasu_60940 [Galdieria sulphuraria]|uniref:Mediator of RNA polymerase II transcription subunit 20 n=1 Tax=Galdieria sulphuraria TaxID=130081 RepID=M2XS75_GALSU|nr:uncharacterized protein Gasu_60940 [Galdieria sulphuraria]EME26269.1 hypothetical protein Gasu_60940 [Galdieria sulphuraria]|eukprot:XP_005702789.1 hypothetical protein Gasu_60940 [Galdieria sulphuraria]
MENTDSLNKNLFYFLGDKIPPTQVEARLKERLECLNASKQNSWSVELETWFNRDTKTWQYILKSLSDSKGGVLLAFRDDSVSNEKYRLFKADSQASQLMEKLQTVQTKSTVSLKGAEYSFGDFIVRLGSVFERKIPSFVVVQILYAPFRETLVPQNVFQEVMHSLCRTIFETPSSSHQGSEVPPQDEKTQTLKKEETFEGSKEARHYSQFHDLVQGRNSEISETAFQFLYLLSLSSRS